MMPLPKVSFRSRARFHTGCLACGFTGLAMCASAQLDLWSSGSASSVDSFGGDPDSYKFIKIPSDTGDWTRHFRIGAMVGFNISANFSEQGTFPVSGSDPANGLFDDGYVRTDSSGNLFGQTSNWGYQNSSQYDYANQKLTMQATSSYSTSGSSKDDGGPFPGFDMAYGDNLWYWKHARVGWELGFGLLPITIKDNSSMAATVNNSVYTFGTPNSDNEPIPSAPYQGGFNRQDGDRTILSSPNNPNGTPLPPANGMVTGTRQLDEMLYTIRLGPSFYWDLTDDFGMSLGAGPAVGIVNGNYKYNETITSGGVSAHNSGEFGTTDVIYGGYVNGTLMYHVLDNADFYLSAQYMPLGNASFSSGGRSAELNLGGQVYVSLGINWPF
jgi:hypothetical protein